jgi:hypothetical protein
VRREAATLSVIAAFWGAAWILAMPDDPEGLIYLALLSVLAVCGPLAFRAVRQRSRRLGVLAAASAAVLLVAAVHRYLTHPLFSLPSPPDLWYQQLLELPVVCIMGIAMGLPAMTFFVFPVGWIRTRRWRQLGLFLALAMALSIASALILLVVDAARKGPLEGYTWRGWYTVFLLGAYAVGALALAAIVVRWISSRWKTRTARSRESTS